MILAGKTVLVTGGGRGIGRAIALKCASEGANVALLARTATELNETSDRISNLGGQSSPVVCDISSMKDVGRAILNARETYGHIDVLVNNAGIQPPIGPFESISIDEWEKNVRVNIFGTIHVTKSVLPEMIVRRRGKIINLSGGGSTSPRANFSAYAVSKTAIVRFTEILAIELTQYNIDVNAISPGAVNTKMLEEVLNAGPLAGTEAFDAEKRRDTGGDDPEIAGELACFLASDDSDGITGKLINAKWDPWREKVFQENLRQDRDIATLRRIDEKQYGRKATT